MARVRLPLMSVAATGSFRDLIFFRTGPHGAEANGPVLDRKPPTTGQLLQQQKFANWLANYGSLDDNDKLAWKSAAAALFKTGHAYYLQQATAQHTTYPDHPTIP